MRRSVKAGRWSRQRRARGSTCACPCKYDHGADMRVPVRVKMRVCPCRYDHGVRMYAYMAVRIPVKTYAQKVPATPQSQVCRICVTWLALGLMDCNAGPGDLLGRIGWGSAALDAGLSGFGFGFFGACGLYGGSAENVWGDGLPMGICQNVWGNRDTVWEAAHVWGGRGIAWEAAKTYGKCHKAWETAPAYGRPPDCMGNENHMKAKNGTMKYSLRTLHVFVNFGGRRRPGMGAAGPRGEPAPMADLA